MTRSILFVSLAILATSCDQELPSDPEIEYPPKTELNSDSAYRANGIDPKTMDGIQPIEFTESEHGPLYSIGKNESGEVVVTVFSEDKKKVATETFAAQDTLMTGIEVLNLDKITFGLGEIVAIGDIELFAWYEFNEGDLGLRYVMTAVIYNKANKTIHSRKFYRRSVDEMDMYTTLKYASEWFGGNIMLKTELTPSMETLYRCFDIEFKPIFSSTAPFPDPPKDYFISVDEFLSAGNDEIVRYRFKDGGPLVKVWAADVSIPDNWDITGKDFVADDDILTITYTIRSQADTEETRVFRVDINTGISLD